MPDPLSEYREVLQEMRQYANMRFAQLTLAAALTGGLFVAAFEANPPLSWRVRLAVKGAGLLIAAAFWVMERRSTAYWVHFRERAVALEAMPELGFSTWTTSPPRSGPLTATKAVSLILLTMAAFWVVAIAVHWSS